MEKEEKEKTNLIKKLNCGCKIIDNNGKTMLVNCQKHSYLPPRITKHTKVFYFKKGGFKHPFIFGRVTHTDINKYTLAQNFKQAALAIKFRKEVYIALQDMSKHRLVYRDEKALTLIFDCVKLIEKTLFKLLSLRRYIDEKLEQQ